MPKRTDVVLLKVDHVTMRYGDKTILNDVCADITDIVDEAKGETGEVICFLGPSGMGKTQLSRIIAGLQIPTSGHVYLHGDHVSRRGDVGFVPQFYPMFDWATVETNLTICGRGRKDTKEKISELVDAFELRDHLKKYPKELSGGTRQRVAICRQLMCTSKYMVMDEPFSGLDPIMKWKAAKVITRLASQGTVVIVVTHDVTEGLTIADTVWMLGYGPTGPSGGASIQYQFDTIQLGFAWRDDLERDPEFLRFVREVKDKFATLK